MRVLVLSNLYPPDVIGGYEVACGQVVDGLRARGHDVRVLTTAPRQPVPPEPPHVRRRFRLADEWNPNALGEPVVLALTIHAHSRFIDAYNVQELIHQVAAFRPDVVYLGSLIGIGGLGLVACLQHLGTPWVWQLGDCIPARLCSGRRGIVPELVAEFNRQVEGDYIIVSEGVRRELEGFGIRLNGRVALVPNWVHGPRPTARRPIYQPGRGPLRIISAGSVNRDKGVDILIEAAHRLRRSGVEDFLVDIYGKVGDPTLADLIRRLDLDGHVTLQGPRPHHELMALYNRYDVVAFPTWEREPFGLVPLEALSRGCVPVMTHRCWVGEWLTHGVHCLKAARDPASFAGALRAVAAGTVPLGPIARRGVEAAWRDFHLDAILPRIENVLRMAATRARPASGHSAADIDRLARLAEQLAEGLIQEATAGDAVHLPVPIGLLKKREACA